MIISTSHDIDGDGKSCVNAVSRVVDFVFCDRNCKIKFKTKGLKSKFFMISSEAEFLNLVCRLDHDISVSIVF